MEWWIGWVIAGLLGLPAAIYYSLRLKSRWKESKDKQQHAKGEVEKALGDIISQIQEYENLKRQSKLREWTNNTLVPKRRRKELNELANLAEEYHKWRWESYQVIRGEFQLAAASQRFEDKHLDEWLRIFGLYEVTEGREREPGETIYKAIYSANLTFELAKDAMLENRRDLLLRVPKETSGEEIEIKLRDIVESDAFYRLTKGLQELQERETIKTVREIRAELLRKAKFIEEG